MSYEKETIKCSNIRLTKDLNSNLNVYNLSRSNPEAKSKITLTTLKIVKPYCYSICIEYKLSALFIAILNLNLEIVIIS